MTERRAICVVVKGYPRLSETFVAQEIRSLELAGLKVSIASLRHPTDQRIHPVHAEISAPVLYLPEHLRKEPKRVLRACLRQIRSLRFWRTLGAVLSDLRYDWSIARLRRFGQALVLAEEMPAGTDFFYAHFIHSPASVTAYAARLTGLGWGCSAHAKDIWTSPDRDLADKLRSALFTLTCTRAGLERLNALAPVDRPAVLMYHGLARNRMPRLSVPLCERDGMLPEKPVRLLTVARAVEKKGLDTLIAALARLPQDRHWHWTHIGGGTQVAALKAQAEAAGIADRCLFKGALAQSDVFAAYLDSDIFVLPCRIAADGDRDGLPNVLMEAGAAGLALVSTAVSGVTEIIEAEQNGLVVAPDRPEELASALLRLMTNPLERYRLGREAARRVQRDFVHEDSIGTLLALLPVTPANAESVHLGQRAML